MRKYHDAGGVLPTRWESGLPDAESHWGRILVEVWRTRWSTVDRSGLTIEARFVVLDRNRDGTEAIWTTSDGSRFTPEHGERVRRWCSLSVRSNAYMNVTLEDWP